MRHSSHSQSALPGVTSDGNYRAAIAQIKQLINFFVTNPQGPVCPSATITAAVNCVKSLTPHAYRCLMASQLFSENVSQGYSGKTVYQFLVEFKRNYHEKERQCDFNHSYCQEAISFFNFIYGQKPWYSELVYKFDATCRETSCYLRIQQDRIRLSSSLKQESLAFSRALCAYILNRSALPATQFLGVHEAVSFSAWFWVAPKLPELFCYSYDTVRPYAGHCSLASLQAAASPVVTRVQSGALSFCSALTSASDSIAQAVFNLWTREDPNAARAVS